MPRFIPKPPVIEAREFTGGENSAIDLQGWLDANGIQSNLAGKDEQQKITFPGNQVGIGEWLIFDGTEFSSMTSAELYTKYVQVP